MIIDRAYISARWSRQRLAKRYAQALRHLGCEVVSTWQDRAGGPNVANAKPGHEAVSVAAARCDESEIHTAAVLVFIADSPKGRYPGGARHVEMGIARALGVPIVLIGQPGNVFQCDVDATFPNWHTFLHAVKMERECGPEAEERAA